jgi:hypothetical protein
MLKNVKMSRRRKDPAVLVWHIMKITNAHDIMQNPEDEPAIVSTPIFKMRIKCRHKKTACLLLQSILLCAKPAEHKTRKTNCGGMK